MSRFKVAVIIVATIVLIVLVTMHVRGMNGPWYWKWSWRRLGAWPLYALMLVAAAPLALGQWAQLRGRIRTAVALVTISCLALQLAAVSSQPPVGGRRLLLIVQHIYNTSYWIDAVVIDRQENIPLADWLYQYPDIVPLLHAHAKYKPPGLVLYYLFWVKLLGRGAASAWAGGLVVALLAALAVPACFRMLHFYLRDRDAAFCGATYLAMCPSLVLFVPQFDQVYVTVACVILTLWGAAARDGRTGAAIACGAMLALGLFMSYIFLILGCFILVHWLLLLPDRGARAFGRATWNGVVALMTIALIYLLIWIVTGFDPIATYRSIANVQMAGLIELGRPFPLHIAFDVLDFALGAGWIGVVLVMFYLARTGLGGAWRERFVVAGIIQIVVVALAALLPGEAARLWMLLLPLLMAPIGLELARWTPAARAIVFACLWLLLVVICQNMNFLYMGPQLDGHGGPFHSS